MQTQPKNDFRHYNVGPCHHSMVHPLVVVGGDSLQIWRVAVNTPNKQLQTANKEWSSSLGVGSGTKASAVINQTAFMKKCRTQEIWRTLATT